MCSPAKLYRRQSSSFQSRKFVSLCYFDNDNDNDGDGENGEDEDDNGDGIIMAMVLHERGK